MIPKNSKWVKIPSADNYSDPSFTGGFNYNKLILESIRALTQENKQFNINDYDGVIIVHDIEIETGITSYKYLDPDTQKVKRIEADVINYNKISWNLN